jgi:hypothetical protein
MRFPGGKFLAVTLTVLLNAVPAVVMYYGAKAAAAVGNRLSRLRLGLRGLTGGGVGESIPSSLSGGRKTVKAKDKNRKETKENNSKEAKDKKSLSPEERVESRYRDRIDAWVLSGRVKEDPGNWKALVRQLSADIEAQDAKIKDWSSRVYKDANISVNNHQKKKESVKSVNERRRQERIKGFERQKSGDMKILRDLAKAGGLTVAELRSLAEEAQKAEMSENEKTENGESVSPEDAATAEETKEYEKENDNISVNGSEEEDEQQEQQEYSDPDDDILGEEYRPDDYQEDGLDGDEPLVPDEETTENEEPSENDVLADSETEDVTPETPEETVTVEEDAPKENQEEDETRDESLDETPAGDVAEYNYIWGVAGKGFCIERNVNDFGKDGSAIKSDAKGNFIPNNFSLFRSTNDIESFFDIQTGGNLLKDATGFEILRKGKMTMVGEDNHKKIGRVEERCVIRLLGPRQKEDDTLKMPVKDEKKNDADDSLSEKPETFSESLENTLKEWYHIKEQYDNDGVQGSYNVDELEKARKERQTFIANTEHSISLLADGDDKRQLENSLSSLKIMDGILTESEDIAEWANMQHYTKDSKYLMYNGVVSPSGVVDRTMSRAIYKVANGLMKDTEFKAVCDKEGKSEWYENYKNDPDATIRKWENNGILVGNIYYGETDNETTGLHEETSSSKRLYRRGDGYPEMTMIFVETSDDLRTLRAKGITEEFDSPARLLDAFRDKYPQKIIRFSDGYGNPLEDTDNHLKKHTDLGGTGITTWQAEKPLYLLIEPWEKYFKNRQTDLFDNNYPDSEVMRAAREDTRRFASLLNISDKVNIITDTGSLSEGEKSVKGWYDRDTDRISVVLPNHSDADDIRRTVFHEGVAHYGLRRLFGEHFDTFLDNVHDNAAADVRQRIDYISKTEGLSRRDATEEYLARLSEDTDFGRAMQSGWWGKIRELFLQMLGRAGVSLNNKLTDSELRYILWRSYENLRSPGERRTVSSLIKKDRETAVDKLRGLYGKINDTKENYAEYLDAPSVKGWISGWQKEIDELQKAYGLSRADVFPEEKSAGTDIAAEETPAVAREQALRDTVSGIIKEAGVDVVYDKEACQEALRAMRQNDDTRYQRVYHGSGADFDRFDNSHMGEGEGAQAHGWGTYVTKSEDIGKGYAEEYDAQVHLFLDGEEMTGDDIESSIRNSIPLADDFFDEIYQYGSYYDKSFAERLKESGVTIDELKEELGDSLSTMKDHHPEEDYSRYDEVVQQIEDELDSVEKDEEYTQPILYTVEIPDDKGNNYIEENGPLSEEQRKMIAEEAEKEGFGDSTLSYRDGKGNLILNADASNGRRLYSNELTRVLGSHKAASEFLSRAGFTGIHYDGSNDGECYVIFDDRDLVIQDNLRFFHTPDGEAYGFTTGGKIYLDPDIATAETPIHEYTHLWAEALRRRNPEEWNNVVGLMKQCDTVWNDVRRNYPELTDDNDIADEVLATYSGRRGAERLRTLRDGILSGDSSEDEKKAATSAIDNFRDLLSRIWKDIADFLHIHYTKPEEVADRVLSDLVNGVNPSKALDDAYSRAVSEGRTDDALRILEDVAKAKGYNVTDYHGRDSWTAPVAEVEKDDFANLDKLRESLDDYGGESNIYGIINGIQGHDSSYYYDPGKAGFHGKAAEETAEIMRSLHERNASPDTKVSIYRAVPNDVFGDEIMQGDWVALSRTYCDDLGKEKYGEGGYHIIQSEVPIKYLWQGDEDMREFGYDDGRRDVEKNVPNNRKLLEITYDDNGKLIPLSKRFDIAASDIRYQFVGEEGIRTAAENSVEAAARLRLLDLARMREKMGTDPTAIKLATGWERGADGKWRYETEDAIHVKPHTPEAEKGTKSYTLSSVLTGKGAQELFAAYPQLRDYQVAYIDMTGKTNGFLRGKNIVIKDSLSGTDTRRTMLHEIQHAVQRIEGFSLGASETNVRARIGDLIDGNRETSEYAKEMLRTAAVFKLSELSLHKCERLLATGREEDADRAVGYYWDAMDCLDNTEESALKNEYPKDMSSEEIAKSGYHVKEAGKELARLYSEALENIPDGNRKSLDIVNKLSNDLENMTDSELYTHVAGEVEARNVARRMDMTPDERRRTLASETEDVARRDQIFLGYNNSYPADSAESHDEENSTTAVSLGKKVEELFNGAVNGTFSGKPVSVGRLSPEGKAFLERLSGLKMKEHVDFVLNPSDLKHIYNDHFGNNEKDRGNNVPLTRNDFGNFYGVLSNPDGIVYGVDKNDGRKLFFFLKQKSPGLYNLAEVCSTKKGNLTAKSYYITKKGINQRVMEIKSTLLPTSVTYSGESLSNTKIPLLFENPVKKNENISEDSINFSKTSARPLDRANTSSVMTNNEKEKARQVQSSPESVGDLTDKETVKDGINYADTAGAASIDKFIEENGHIVGKEPDRNFDILQVDFRDGSTLRRTPQFVTDGAHLRLNYEFSGPKVEGKAVESVNFGLFADELGRQGLIDDGRFNDVVSNILRKTETPTLSNKEALRDVDSFVDKYGFDVLGGSVRRAYLDDKRFVERRDTTVVGLQDKGKVTGGKYYFISDDEGRLPQDAAVYVPAMKDKSDNILFNGPDSYGSGIQAVRDAVAKAGVSNRSIVRDIDKFLENHGFEAGDDLGSLRIVDFSDGSQMRRQEHPHSKGADYMILNPSREITSFASVQDKNNILNLGGEGTQALSSIRNSLLSRPMRPSNDVALDVIGDFIRDNGRAVEGSDGLKAVDFRDGSSLVGFQKDGERHFEYRDRNAIPYGVVVSRDMTPKDINLSPSMDKAVNLMYNALDKPLNNDVTLSKEAQDMRSYTNTQGRWHGEEQNELRVYSEYGNILAYFSDHTSKAKPLGVEDYVIGRNPTESLMLSVWKRINHFNSRTFIPEEKLRELGIPVNPMAKPLPLIRDGREGRHIVNMYNIESTDFLQRSKDYDKETRSYINNLMRSAEHSVLTGDGKYKMWSQLEDLVVKNGNWHLPVESTPKDYDRLKDMGLSARYDWTNKKVSVAPLEMEQPSYGGKRYMDILDSLSESVLDRDNKLIVKNGVGDENTLNVAHLMNAIDFGIDLRDVADRPDVSGEYVTPLITDADALRSEGPEYVRTVLTEASKADDSIMKRSIGMDDDLSVNSDITIDDDDDDRLDLRTTTPGMGDDDGDGISDDQENYAPSTKEDNRLKRKSDESSHRSFHR